MSKEYIPTIAQNKVKASNARIIIFKGGNRSGKNVVGTAECMLSLESLDNALILCDDIEHEMKCFFSISQEFNLLKGVKDFGVIKPMNNKYFDFEPQSFIFKKNNTLKIITFIKKSNLSLKHLDKQIYDFIWMNECQNISDASQEMQLEFFDKVIVNHSHSRAQILITLTPYLGSEWVRDIIAKQNNAELIDADLFPPDEFTQELTEAEKCVRVKGEWLSPSPALEQRA